MSQTPREERLAQLAKSWLDASKCNEERSTSEYDEGAHRVAVAQEYCANALLEALRESAPPAAPATFAEVIPGRKAANWTESSGTTVGPSARVSDSIVYLPCGHGKWDTRFDCLPCCQFTIEQLNQRLVNERIERTRAESSIASPSELALLEARREEAERDLEHNDTYEGSCGVHMERFCGKCQRLAELDRAIAAAKGKK